MSLSTIRTELKTVIEGVSGIGIVHDYLRHAASDSYFKSLFKTSTDKIHSWQITRRSTKEIPHDTYNTVIRQHTFLIFGIYALSDASATEKTFQDIIESICADIRTEVYKDAPLSGQAFRVNLPQVERVEHRNYGKMLCHSCDITVIAEEYLTL